MAVRVRIRVKGRNGKSIVTTVLANGGAESPRPLIVLDPSTASKICFKDDRDKDYEIVEVAEASRTRNVRIYPQAVILDLLSESEEILSSTTADLAIEEDLIEPLITDVTIDALGIQVISFGKGLWRHIRDPPNTVRLSSQ